MNELFQLAKILRDTSTVFSTLSMQALDSSDITWQQVLILEQIAISPKTMGEISKAIDLSYSTTSGLISRLEQMNLVRRFRDKSDRRIVWAALTERVTANWTGQEGSACTPASLHSLRALILEKEILS
ncbi:MarR family winged helix-turn-helix transcriptional regulator [Brevibacillus porteri]|uniref:Transcriptional regulator n=1 Tax=Brevibacillus porteri TaxID=2126350 RepID=A0ABX5FWH3_9BACL|nr:MarR family transcriptional regulator [Brevibacillus porteri]MED1797438.1 MarR family transcriptional regulator [Brevibacillus porteri]MED2129508.1 MarR family transcriptional regulator [Brevibacillus porteri]MED2743609.1 MarR family transcriptional regulator [Brevibacillus porteri]MED2815167.1 MarR family transcriptional regulator [Brevibacillus porteri]MED2897166.1 MarR family transcriptional regulator [Brevibacillus porteri]